MSEPYGFYQNQYSSKNTSPSNPIYRKQHPSGQASLNQRNFPNTAYSNYNSQYYSPNQTLQNPYNHNQSTADLLNLLDQNNSIYQSTTYRPNRQYSQPGQNNSPDLQNKKLQDKINSLQQEINELKITNNSLKNTNERLERENEAFKRATEVEASTIAANESGGFYSKKKKDEKKAKLKEDLNQLQNLLKDTNKINDELALKCSSLEQTNKSKDQEYQNLLDKYNSLKPTYEHKIQQLNQNYQNLTNEYDSLKQTTNQQIQQLNQNYQNLTNEYDSLKKTADQQIQQLNNNLNSKQLEITAANDNYQQLTNQFNSLKQTTDRQIQQLNDDLNLKQQEIANKEREIKDLNANHQKSHEIEILGEETIDNLEKIEEINSGARGKVYKVFKKLIYALKEMKIGRENQENLQSFINEYEILNFLNHPNILKTFGIFMSNKTKPPSILLEYCPSDLELMIKNKKYKAVQLVFAIYQIIEGMKYVHFRKIIHRDLKPSNILIAKDGTIKICDFGMAKLMTSKEQSMTFGIGTQNFMAPEIINEESNYDEKVDVYSFGVLVYFMLSGGNMPVIRRCWYFFKHI